MENGYRALAHQLAHGKMVYRKTWLDRQPVQAQNLEQRTEDFPHTLPCIGMEGKERVLYERFRSGKTLLICGAGHISVPLCTLGTMLGYEVVILDDRADFACDDRFPQAQQILCGEFSELLRSYDWETHPDTSVVIVTRGHAADTDCLRHVLDKPLTYLGMIGSQKKNKTVLQRLAREGFSPDQLERICAPIGLDIGAQTPEEIAVSIAAQLIQTRQAITDSVLPLDMIQALLDDNSQGGIMATVVHRQGSVPRGIGARMMLLPDGSVLGTIGGGMVEFQTLEKMKRWTPSEWGLFYFDMTNSDAGSSGMICGGGIDVLFEVI